MRSIKPILILISLWSYWVTSHGGESDQRPLLIMGTSDGPPYMDKANNAGLDIEIPITVLERLGYRVEVRYMSLARAEVEVRSKRVDFTAPLFIGDKPHIHSSDPHIHYRPTVFSLKENNLLVTTLKDIGQYSIMTFQGAGGYFGNEFIEASYRSPNYTEVHDMTVLPKLLLAKRTELVVLDYHIFRHQLKSIPSLKNWRDKIGIHDVIPRVPAVVGFHNRDLRDAFNQELAALRAEGRHEAIVQRYSPE